MNYLVDAHFHKSVLFIFAGISPLGLDRNFTMSIEETDEYQCACLPDFNCLEGQNYCNTTRGVGVSAGHYLERGGWVQTWGGGSRMSDIILRVSCLLAAKTRGTGGRYRLGRRMTDTEGVLGCHLQKKNSHRVEKISVNQYWVRS